MKLVETYTKLMLLYVCDKIFTDSIGYYIILISNCSLNVSVLYESLAYGHESKPANSNFSNFFLFDKFKGNTLLHNVLKNRVPTMSLYTSIRRLSKPAISARVTFQRNKTGHKP